MPSQACAQTPRSMKWRRVGLPLLLFAGTRACPGVGQGLNPREVPSPLLAKPAPDFRLSRWDDPTRALGRDGLRGPVGVRNARASWCAPCRQAQPRVVERQGVSSHGRIGPPRPDAVRARIEPRLGSPGVHRPEPAQPGPASWRAAVTLRALVLARAVAGLLLALLGAAVVHAQVGPPVSTAPAAQAAPATADPALEARVMRLAAELRCLVCQNETIAGSSAELAVDLRNQVRDMLRTGATEAEVMRYMTDRYGDFVRYRPPWKPATVALWTGPFVLLVAGTAVLFLTLRRRARLGPEHFEPDGEGQEPAGPARAAAPGGGSER